MKMSLTKSPIQIGFLFLSCLGLFATVCEAGNEISFKNDVMPVFMRGGCNAGDCHGAARAVCSSRIPPDLQSEEVRGATMPRDSVQFMVTFAAQPYAAATALCNPAASTTDPAGPRA